MNPWQLWVNALNDPIGKWITWLTLLLIMIVIAIYVAKFFRDLAVGESNDGLGQWSEFQRLHAEGKLSPWEYQRLKATVPKRLADQMLSKPTGNESAGDDPANQRESGETTQRPDEGEDNAV